MNIIEIYKQTVLNAWKNHPLADPRNFSRVCWFGSTSLMNNDHILEKMKDLYGGLYNITNLKAEESISNGRKSFYITNVASTHDTVKDLKIKKANGISLYDWDKINIRTGPYYFNETTLKYKGEEYIIDDSDVFFISDKKDRETVNALSEPLFSKYTSLDTGTTFSDFFSEL
jgi:hypothetical protein